MPKIIKNLDENIRNKAFELFSSRGYDEVDIKLIAKECGMAVGTFYNYYSSKMELFMHILKLSWKKTFDKLEAIEKLDLDLKEKLELQIEILYDGIEERRGLGFYVQQKYTFSNNKDTELHEFIKEITQNITKIFIPLKKIGALSEFDNVDERLGQILIVEITKSLSMSPKDRENNIKFIKVLVLALIEE